MARGNVTSCFSPHPWQTRPQDQPHKWSPRPPPDCALPDSLHHSTMPECRSIPPTPPPSHLGLSFILAGALMHTHTCTHTHAHTHTHQHIHTHQSSRWSSLLPLQQPQGPAACAQGVGAPRGIRAGSPHAQQAQRRRRPPHLLDRMIAGSHQVKEAGCMAACSPG